MVLSQVVCMRSDMHLHNECAVFASFTVAVRMSVCMHRVAVPVVHAAPGVCLSARACNGTRAAHVPTYLGHQCWPDQGPSLHAEE